MSPEQCQCETHVQSAVFRVKASDLVFLWFILWSLQSSVKMKSKGFTIVIVKSENQGIIIIII